MQPKYIWTIVWYRHDIGRRSESGAPGQPVRDGEGDGGGAVRPEPVEAAAQAAGPTRTVTRDLSDSDRSPASQAVTSTDPPRSHTCSVPWQS